MAKVTEVLTVELTLVEDFKEGNPVELKPDQKAMIEEHIKNILQFDHVQIIKDQIFLSDRPAEEPKGIVLE